MITLIFVTKIIIIYTTYNFKTIFYKHFILFKFIIFALILLKIKCFLSNYKRREILEKPLYIYVH